MREKNQIKGNYNGTGQSYKALKEQWVKEKKKGKKNLRFKDFVTSRAR